MRARGADPRTPAQGKQELLDSSEGHGDVAVVTAGVHDALDLGGGHPVRTALDDRQRVHVGAEHQGGRIAIASQPRCPGATAETSREAGQAIATCLVEAGFSDTRIETLPLEPPVVCVLATNAGS